MISEFLETAVRHLEKNLNKKPLTYYVIVIKIWRMDVNLLLRMLVFSILFSDSRCQTICAVDYELQTRHSSIHDVEMGVEGKSIFWGKL